MRLKVKVGYGYVIRDTDTAVLDELRKNFPALIRGEEDYELEGVDELEEILTGMESGSPGNRSTRLKNVFPLLKVHLSGDEELNGSIVVVADVPYWEEDVTGFPMYGASELGSFNHPEALEQLELFASANRIYSEPNWIVYIEE